MRYTIMMLCLCCGVHVAAQEFPSRIPALGSDEQAAQQAEDPTLLLYPNPTSGRFFVHWGKRSLLRMPVEVRAMDGRLMRLDAVPTNDELDVSALPDGTYTLYLMDLSGVRARRSFRVAH